MYPFVPILVLILLFLAFWAGYYFLFAGILRSVRLGAKHTSERILQSKVKKKIVGRYPRIRGAKKYIPIYVVLIVGIIITFAAGDLFLDLAEDFQIQNTAIYKADHAVNHWFEGERHMGLTVFFNILTNAASPVFLGLLIGIITILLYTKKRKASAIFIAGTAIGGFLLNAGLKMIFTRARPDAATAIAVADWYSFPSGHAMASFIILGSLGYLVLRLGMGWIGKSGLLALITMLVLLVGVSRVYLGVHWISDIIAGWSAGTIWLITTIVAYETLVRIRHIRKIYKKNPN